MSIEESFSKLLTIYKNRDLAVAFSPGVTEEAIRDFEGRNNVSLPFELRQFYLMADGSSNQPWGILGKNEPIKFPPFAKATEYFSLNWPNGTIEMAVPPGGEINEKASTCARVNWFPFATFNGSTTAVICDLEPGPKGRIGQILIYRMPDEIEVTAASFGEFFDEAITALRNHDWMPGDAHKP
jgi:cell wall assembly regulator SMI1